MSLLYRCFFPSLLTILRLTLITINSLYFPSDVKYIYTSALNSSDSSVSESSSSSMSNIFKGIDMKTFPKSMKDNIRSTIAILYSVSIMLVFFWDTGFQGNFFGCRQSLAKCFTLS